MSDQGDPLARIAAALERMAPGPPAYFDWTAHPAYFWHAGEVHAVAQVDALPLDRLKGIDRQKQVVCENVARHAAGAASHDMLLWGARGMGKSALLRAAVVEEQRSNQASLALIQLDLGSLAALPELFEAIGSVDRRFLLYLDDLAFDHGDDAVLRHLRSALEGSLAPRPANVRLAVTSNHRAILARMWRARFLSAQDETSRRRVLDQHGQITEGLQQRDAHRVRVAVEDHLRHLLANLRDYFEDADAPAARAASAG